MINDLKSKLPFGKKAKSSDDESEEIEANSNSSRNRDATDATDISDLEIPDNASDDSSLVNKLKSKISLLQKSRLKAATSDDDLDEDVEAKKKKKKSKALQLIIGGGLVIFILSDYIIPTEEPVAVPKLKPVKRSKKPKVEGDAPIETSAETPSEVSAETLSEIPVETLSEVPAETSSEVPAETPSEIPVETPIETPATESDPVPETIDTPSTDGSSTWPSTDSLPPQESSTDTVDGGETTTPGEENITDQILEDLEKQANVTRPVEQKKEYVAPPDYEYRGRGLVYNCTGKHWACVDAPSYKACEDNSSSVKYLKKKTECYPFNVYETPKGCDTVQNRMVSSSAKTDFCND